MYSDCHTTLYIKKKKMELYSTDPAWNKQHHNTKTNHRIHKIHYMCVCMFVRCIRYRKSYQQYFIKCELRVSQTKNKHNRATHKRTPYMMHSSYSISHFISCCVYCYIPVAYNRRQQAIHLAVLCGRAVVNSM